MFKTAKKLSEKRYDVAYINNTMIPKTFICPNCLERAKKFTKNPVLQQRAARHVVIGIKTNKKSVKHLAMCSQCSFTKEK